MAAEEAAQRQDHFTNVGEATLEYFRGETIRLSRRFPTASKLELFGSVKLLHDTLMTYLEGHQRADQTRDLSFLAGAACGMLAEVTDNLGYFDAATAHIRLGLLFANEANSAPLRAWLIGEHSLIACHQGLPKRARDFAREAARMNQSGTGSVNAWVRTLEARGAALLGDAQGAQDALNQANESRERHSPDDLDEFGGILACKRPKQHFNSTHVYVILGNGEPVIPEAEAAVEGYENGPAEDRAVDAMAHVQVHAAAAHVMNDDVDAAKETVRPALRLRPELRTAGLDQSLQRLHQRLRSTRYRESSTAIEVRDQIEEVLSIRPSLP